MAAKKTTLRSKTAKPILLDQIRGNAGVGIWYKSKLSEAVQLMAADYDKEIKKSYKSGVNVLATDAKSQVTELDKTLESLMTKWSKRFDELADELAPSFVEKSLRHTDLSMMNVLRKHDFAIKFRMSKPISTLVRASVKENVNLIKSIQSKYHTQVETLTWESVRNGGDLASLTEELVNQFGVTLDRAAFIASDQNNKATGEFEHQRRIELGINKSMWIHSHGAKVPRASHVAAHRKVYDTEKGCLIDGEYIQPGQKIRCGCGSRGIIPGAYEEE